MMIRTWIPPLNCHLTDQLTLAGEILDLAREIKPMPFLDDLLYRIEIQLNNIQGNLGAGSDVQVLEFLHQDVEQCFDTLDRFKNYDAGISKKIEKGFIIPPVKYNNELS